MYFNKLTAQTSNVYLYYQIDRYKNKLVNIKVLQILEIQINSCKI